MAENTENTIVKSEDNIEQNQSQPSPIELKAMEEGWVPQDEWQGEPDAWRPAKEFVDRGELFKKIDDQNRTVKQLKQALDDLKGHHARVRETEYARALQSLKNQKKEAMTDGDADAVLRIEDQIDLVKEEQTNLRIQTAQARTQIEDIPAPEFVAWTSRNKWYTNDEGMKGYADSIGRSLSAAGLSPTAVLAEVEKRVKTEFPHKFTNPNRAKAGSVEGSSAKGGTSGESFDLSPVERQVMERFVKQGIMTKEKYITELKANRKA